VVGAAIFGVGWAVADSCPAPIAAQLTQGVWWSAFTIAGIGIGVVAFLRRQERAGRRELERSQRAVEPAVAPPIGV
jgi:hypothetical protein